MFLSPSYLTLKVIPAIIMELDKIYGDNIRNLHYALYPHFYHPLLESVLMAIVIITVILSVDRYVAVFYPFRIYRLKCDEQHKSAKLLGYYAKVIYGFKPL